MTPSTHSTLLPEGWSPPIGYANGIVAAPGPIVFIAGQVGWNARQQFESADLVPQFEQALKNLLEVLKKAGGEPQQICRITAYCCDKPAYLEARRSLGAVWRRQMGEHYPAMSMIFVSDLLDSPGKIELEATAVLPPNQAPTMRAAPARQQAQFMPNPASTTDAPR